MKPPNLLNDELFQVQTHVFKRTHDSGAVTWIVQWKSPLTGKWKKVAAGRTKSEALLFEAKIRRELGNGRDPSLLMIDPSGKLSVSSVIDQFLAHSRYLSGSQGWQTEARARLYQWVKPELGSVAFSELTRDRILKFYIQMRDQGAGPWTIIKVHTAMCLLGDLHEELAPGTENIARKIKGLGRMFPKGSPKRDINFLTPDELEKIILACTGAKNRLLRPLVDFLANTGLRRSEALNLKWTDIDLSAGFIQIRQSKNGKPRTIPLEAQAFDAIKDLQKKSGFVFLYRDGTRPHEDSFLKPLRRAGKRVGIEKRIDLHTLRHSYGSNKIRMGWGLKKVSMLLGHSDISITSNVYTHLLDGDLRVRDDFRFSGAGSGKPPSPGAPTNTEMGNSNTPSAKAVQAAELTHAITAALIGSPGGAETLGRIISNLEVTTKVAEANMSDETRAVICADLKSSVEILRGLQENPKKAFLVPPMSRALKNGEEDLHRDDSPGPGLSFDISKLREKKLVELSGFEPLTSSMPWKRSTN